MLQKTEDRRPASQGASAEDATLKTAVKSSKEAMAIADANIRTRVVPALTRSGFPIVARGLQNARQQYVRLLKGSLEDDRTPLFKSVSRGKVISDWYDLPLTPKAKESFTLANKVCGNSEMSDILLKTDHDQSESTGPQSPFASWVFGGDEKTKAVFSDKRIPAGFNWDAWNKAKTEFSSLLPKSTLKLLSRDEVIADTLQHSRYNPMDPTTSAGWPFLNSKWKWNLAKKPTTPMEEYRAMGMKWYVDRADLFRRTVAKYRGRKIPLSERLHFMAQTGIRLVQKGEEWWKSPKHMRVICMMNKDEAIIGRAFVAPLQAWCADNLYYNGLPIIPAWGSVARLDKVMNLILQEATDKGRTVDSMDYSSFDASVVPELMWEVYHLIAKAFRPEDQQYIIEYAYSLIFLTGCTTPTSVFEEGPSSVKSGSISTSLIGCFVNIMVLLYAKHRGLKQGLVHFAVMGDDAVADGPTPEELETYAAECGMTLNADKAYYEFGSLHFLQRTYVYNFYGGIGSAGRILMNSLSLEDDTSVKWEERGNPYVYCVQAIARLENACFHPQFDMLVDYVAKGDAKYHLGAKMDARALLKASGSYGERKEFEATFKPWTQKEDGKPFEYWAVNRVLRGEQHPLIGTKDYFKWVYNQEWDEVAV